MKTVTTLTLALAVAMAIGCESTQSGGDSGAKEISVRYHGDDAAFPWPEVYVIQSKAQLEKMNSKELADIEYIDWDKSTVIVLAAGEQSSGGYWAHITGVDVKDGKLFVRGMLNKPAEEAAATQAITYPYCAAEVAKFDASGLTVVPEITEVTGQDRPAP